MARQGFQKRTTCPPTSNSHFTTIQHSSTGETFTLKQRNLDRNTDFPLWQLDICVSFFILAILRTYHWDSEKIHFQYPPQVYPIDSLARLYKSCSIATPPTPLLCSAELCPIPHRQYYFSTHYAEFYAKMDCLW